MEKHDMSGKLMNMQEDTFIDLPETTTFILKPGIEIKLNNEPLDMIINFSTYPMGNGFKNFIIRMDGQDDIVFTKNEIWEILKNFENNFKGRT